MSTTSRERRVDTIEASHTSRRSRLGKSELCVQRCRRWFDFPVVFLLQVNNRKYPKLKEVDDVLGGAAAWENVDSTAGK